MTSQVASCMRSKKMSVNRPVFFISAVITTLAGLACMLWPSQSRTALDLTQSVVVGAFGWFYMVLIAICMGLVCWLAFSRYGDVLLGEPGSKPAISTLSWSTMLFSAGIGIALIYYGAYEPLDHYLKPPQGPAATVEAAHGAMALTFLHWGLHGWTLYAMVATTLAYFAYCKGLPLALRSPLVAIFGDRINGSLGDLVDCLGVLATMVSMVTNVGIGALLVHSGLHHLFGIPMTMPVQITITIVMMMAVAVTVVAGVDKGIALLSNVNLAILCGILLFVLSTGPTEHIFQGIVQNTGDYLASFIPSTFNMYLYGHAEKWMAAWTLFFWAWWIAWTPFVGLFIARISKGRTIRQLVLGVTFIPLGFTLVWLAIFGNTAIDLVRSGAGAVLVDAVQNDPPMALYRLLETLPLSGVIATVAVFASFVLFLTPVNSGAFMIASLSMRDSAPDEDAPVWMRLVWVAAIAVISLGLLIAGNFDAMQMAVVLCGLPFSIVLTFYMIGLVRALRSDEAASIVTSEVGK